MVRLHKTKHLSWVNQKLALHFPRISEYFPAVPPLVLVILSSGYAKLASYIWPFIDQLFFKKPDSLPSGILAYVLVIIPIQCVIAATLIFMLNEFLTLEPFETRWQRHKPVITGVVFLSIGGSTIYLNSLVFNALGSAFLSDLGTGLGLTCLLLVTVVAVICCWPALSTGAANTVNTSALHS